MLAATLCLMIFRGVAATSSPRPIKQAFSTVAWSVDTAQSPASPPRFVAETNRVVVNGRPLTLAWSQYQGAIGIADSGLLHGLGVELLNTESAAQQPVQWFSQPSVTPLQLSTWLTQRHRFLDITSLSRRAGWQVDVRGDTLHIATPTAGVIGVRQGRQSWGDRLVIDLDRPTPWQIIEDGNGFTVAIDAQSSQALRSLPSRQGVYLTGFRLEQSGNQTLLRLQTANGIRPYGWTLPNPTRLVIDLRPDALVQRNIVWAPGMRWRQQLLTLGRDRFPVVWLEIDPRQPGLTLRPITSNPLGAVGTTPLLTMAAQAGAIAAMNGGFFNRNNQLPLGAIRRDGQWFSGAILNRGAVGWNDAGEVGIDRLSLQTVLITENGQQFPILHLNSGYVTAGLSLYTSEWGATYTPLTDQETLIGVQNNQVVTQQVSGIAGQAPVAIPANGALLVARANATAATALPTGTRLQWTITTNPTNFNAYPSIMGGGPLLIKNRQIVLNADAEGFSSAFSTQAAPRSVIATTGEGTLIMATIHNRVGGSGATLEEAAQLMQQWGAIDALNLDGGSSTSLYLNGVLLNRPPQTAARVHNGIGVFIQPSF